MQYAAGINSLSVHLHGGDSETVVRMISDIKLKAKYWEDYEEIKNYLEAILDNKAEDKSVKIY